MSETHTCIRPKCSAKGPQLTSEFHRSSNGWLDSDGIMRHPYCKTCDSKRRLANLIRRHYCTILMPNGRIEDWIYYPHRKSLEKTGGKISDHWQQNRPGDTWPTRKEFLMGGYPKSINDMKKCTRCGKVKSLDEYHNQTNGSKFSYCKECNQDAANVTNKLYNPKNNAISRVMHQRMTDMGLGTSHKEHYAAEHGELRLRLRKEIEADGSWRKYVVGEPNQQTETLNLKKIKKVRPPRRVKVESRWEWDTTGTCSDLRDNLEITEGVCELTGTCFESCDTSHLMSQKQCKDLGRPDLIGDPDNAALLDMRINRAMEPKHGFTFLEIGQLIPPPGGEYYPWMVEAGLPEKRIKVTEGRLTYIRMAAMERTRWGDLA